MTVSPGSVPWRSIVIACIAAFTCAGAQSVVDEKKALYIAAFNIQNLGTKKIQNDDVRDVIIKIISRYDIVLVQEIVDKKEQVIFTLLKDLNKAVDDEDEEYDVIVGPRVGRTMAKEQYAYIYKKNKVDVIKSYSYHDPADAFEREPFVATFSPTYKEILTKFALVGIHTKPTDAVAELQHLDVVADNIAAEGTKDIIILGDFNGDCDYVRKKHWSTIPLWMNEKYNWLIGNEIDTTVTNSNCAYDRIVTTGDKMGRAVVEGSAAPFHFDEEYDLAVEAARAVSDHYPVEVTLNVASRARRRAGE